jgi:1,4-dihydroxy-2-naphthoyl-CoA hydrolase
MTDGADAPTTLHERMGIEIIEATSQRLVARMPVEGNVQPFGLLHGGASCVLAETLGSIGATMHAEPERVAVGVDINATHHRAVRTGVVTGVATPVHLGRTVACYEVVISDERERRVCTARITCQLVVRPPAAGSGEG